MRLTRREHLVLMGAGVAAGLVGTSAGAQDAPVVHEVQMLNANPDDPKQKMVFAPDIVRAKVGDTVRFLPVDKQHFSQSYDDVLPAGAEGWKGKMNQEMDLVLAADGAYAYKCTPHEAMGMVGLILVGDVSGNYDAVKAKKFPGRVKDRFEDIFARADAMLAEEGTVAG